MFFLQLRQLVWKNYVIRTRSKVRVVAELVWPLILFAILAWVRTRGLKEYKSECFLEERSLPSTGTLNFVQSLLCTYSNKCFDSPRARKSLTGDLQYEHARKLIYDTERVLLNRVTDNVTNSGTKASMDVAAGLAFLFKSFSGDSSGISIPVQSIINKNALEQLAERRNLSSLEFAPLMNSSVKLPSLDDLRNIQTDPSALFCNSTFMQSWLNSSSHPELIQNFTNLLCESSTTEILSLLNMTASLNQTLKIVELSLGQPLHLNDWSLLVRTLGQILMDIRDLESLSDVFRQIKDTSVGKVATHLWESGAVRESNGSRSFSFDPSSINSSFSILCGNSVSAEDSDISPIMKRRESSVFRKTFLKTMNRTVTPRSGLTPMCAQLFFSLQQNPATRLFFEAFYPFIRGKLVYAPDTAPFNRIVQEVNTTFQELRQVQNVARVWLTRISPPVKNVLNQVDPEMMANLTQMINNTFPAIDQIISPFLINVTSQIETLRELVVQIDLLANIVDTYIDCYEFDKFEAYPNEEQAVIRGMNLLNSGEYSQLWAVIIFEGNVSNSAPHSGLPRHITYKLRMDSSRLDSTKRLKDFFETPIPRTSPSVMKYFTSGFIFLQDKIEQAIIKLQSNRTVLPGMVMQQFPSPCYVYDTFFVAIAQLFPLFMILSFVYTCAMIVKSVVHEKERRLKETMRTMGLGNAVHWVAWFIDSMTFMIIACLLLSIILIFGQVLEKSNFLIVFIFLLSFGIATICFSFLISTFFSRANLAAACGGFIFFVAFLPYNFLNLDSQDYSQSILVSSSLLSNVAFGIGCWYFATFEQSTVGAQWNNIAISPKDGDSYSLLGCILMMLLDAVIYLTVTWYIEAVFPGQYGVPKPWYFMFQPSYWCSMKSKSQRVFNGADETESSSDLIEEEARNLQIGVSLRNLGKTYSNGKVAVRNLNLNFYEDQITSFLGHNGAGKTTTISILTGLYPPTTGTATVNGLDIRHNMDQIRQQLGLCPQHNVLFDQLTVEEHLRFYASLKIGEQAGTRKEIDRMIEDLGLTHKKYELSRHLSGGMKRKLSIGAAFIGNSKTVILDEPTAGVDPYSRRSIWDILLKLKAGRTIILTTHFMDEADLLGDRIAIISQGSLKCCGSSLFLKRKLGSGYYLTLVRKEESNPSSSTEENQVEIPPRPANPISDVQNVDVATRRVEDVVSMVKGHIPNSSVVQDVGTDLVICLPEFDADGVSQRDKFPQLFQNLETQAGQLGLDSYGVSDTTLEEIFLKVADDPSDGNTSLEPDAEAEAPDQVRIPNLPTFLLNGTTRNYRYEEAPQREECGSESFNLVSSEKLRGSRLIVQQFFALYCKRFWNSKRNLKGFFCEVILPAVFIIINQLTTRVWNPIQPEPAIRLSPWLYGSPTTGFLANHNPERFWLNSYVDDLINRTGMGVRCVAGDPLGLPCSQSTAGIINPWANPETYENVRCPCDLGIATCPANSSEGELRRYRSVSTDEFYDVDSIDINLWIVRTHKQMKKSRFGGFEFEVAKPLNKLNFTVLSQDLQNLALASRLEQFLQLDTARKILNFENVTRLLGSLERIKVWFDNKAWASSVSYLNAINNVILRSSIPVSSEDPSFYGISAINHPMNYSTSDLQDRLTRLVGISVLHAISVIFSMSFVPASFVIFLVEERTSKAKHLQFISGVKPLVFWTASYIWDMINYIIPCFLVILIFFAFDQQAYIGPSSIGGLILLLILYGLSAIPLMYPASLVFSVPSSAFVGLACGNLFLGVVTTISSFVLQLFDDEELKFIGSILNEVFLILPHYCLGRGMIDMAQVYFTAQRFQLIGLDYQRSIFEWDFLGRYFVAMIIQAIVFFTFTIALHYQVLQSITHYFQNVDLSPLEVEDEDVSRERARVEQAEDSTDELRLLRLTKVYGRSKVPATDRLSFGLRKGECFGLLGVNGAGKSTTFKMLTGDETVTSGNAFVGGYSIISHLTDAQQNLGYCPQEDALLSLLTGAEHLKLFAYLRGVPRRYLKKVVNDSLVKLSLLPYKNRCAGTFSGGNKRKLATAIALIGNPAVVFLDEPSSGMDPRARRSLWQVVIDAVKDARSVLLTSHSMEECQVLCTRLAIMVNGTLRCLGSAQHLKNRFGDGYMINVRCDVETRVEVLQSVQTAIPEATLREQRPRQLVWHIKPDILPISTLFSRMETARAMTNMVDYSITQTTLDDVFVRFARLQREVQDQEIEQRSEDPVEIDATPSVSLNTAL